MASGKRAAPTFAEGEIQALFGHEAAEDEDPTRLREYYFKSATFDQVINDLPLRLLVGHKGIGKSALFQIALAEDNDASRLALMIKPDDIADLSRDTTDFLRAVRLWKEGLTSILALRALAGLGIPADDPGAEPVRSGQLIPYLREKIQSGSTTNVDPTRQQIAQQFLQAPTIFVYLDDLDRGWQGRKDDVTRLSAMLSAVRDLANENRGLKFRISLRSDVYFLVRTSDESTDKIEGSVIWHTWSNHEIFVLLVKRIETYFGREHDGDSLLRMGASALGGYLDQVMDPRFQGRGHWSNAPMYRVLMSLIRKRPRDLVKLCTLAARAARTSGHDHITTADFESIFEEYSQGRIQDTVNEFRSELPDIERLILGMRPSRRELTTREGYTYTTADLLKKIKDVCEQGQFKFAFGRPATTQDLAALLYKINFITARRDQDNDVVLRRYFEESRYLQSKFADFGFDWEIHPAYRWALQPANVNDIYRMVKLTAD